MSVWVLRFYALMMRLAQPFLRRKLVRRALKEPGYGVAVEERFGFYTQTPEKLPELVWMHAVSLGETRTAAILINALRAQQPGLRVAGYLQLQPVQALWVASFGRPGA